jgi:hypothetical protein
MVQPRFNELRNEVYGLLRDEIRQTLMDPGGAS